MEENRDRGRLHSLVCVAVWGLVLAGNASADSALDAHIAALVTGRAAATAPPLAPEVDRAWIERVYSPPRPVWFTPDGPRAAAHGALRQLRAAADRGLAPADYNVDELERKVAAAGTRPPDPDALARTDVALTATVLRYLSDLRYGRVAAHRVEPHFRVRRSHAAFVAGLRDAAERDRLADLVAAAEPKLPQYAELERLLAEYRSLAERPMPRLPRPASRTGKVAVGDTYAGVGALHTTLMQLGDLPQGSELPVDERLSETLAEGLRRFQARHGLLPDGILGKETLAALDVPLAARVRQIVLSLERLRWLPDFASGPLIVVNIPSFRLWAFARAPGEEPATLSMPVIVGRAMRSETPAFLGEMRYVEFKPYWNVPSGILRNEILPRVLRDPSYLAREDMEIVSTRGDGRVVAPGTDDGIAALRSGEARLRQRPGAGNALGGVKFVLPNTMDIYLHATPARELFERTQRDFSHGCIRVRDPEALALFALRGLPEWTAAGIEAAVTSGATRRVALAAPIPVVVFYATAGVDREGRPHFLRDVYGHDRKLLDALRATGRSVP